MKESLPVSTKDQFRQANILHKCVCEHIEKASECALQIGEILIAAKSAIPYGNWGKECESFFEGSMRTARLYMQFYRQITSLPERQRIAVLNAEGTMVGATKAAKRIIRKEQGEEESVTIDVESKPHRNRPADPREDIEIPDDVFQDDPFEEETLDLPSNDIDPFEDDEPESAPVATSEAVKASLQIKSFADTISRWLGTSPTLDEINMIYSSRHGFAAINLATKLYETLRHWEQDIK